MKTEEKILEMHLGSDFYLVKENGMLKHIINAMREYASQFKTVEPEKRAELLKEIMDTDQEHGMYETDISEQDGFKECPFYTNIMCKCEHECEKMD